MPIWLEVQQSISVVLLIVYHMAYFKPKCIHMGLIWNRANWLQLSLHSPSQSQNSMMTSSNGDTFRVAGPLCGHKGQWRGALKFSVVCAWINVWVKKSRRQWFETPSRSLWRQCNVQIERGASQGTKRSLSYLISLLVIYFVQQWHQYLQLCRW